jgi:hypothetical protein
MQGIDDPAAWRKRAEAAMTLADFVVSQGPYIGSETLKDLAAAYRALDSANAAEGEA